MARVDSVPVSRPRWKSVRMRRTGAPKRRLTPSSYWEISPSGLSVHFSSGLVASLNESIRLESFSKASAPDLYHAYLQIKYQVFVVEGHWENLSDPHIADVARADAFDDRGRFLIACAVDGRPVGVVRGIRLRDGFPHEKLLAHHIR